MELGKQKTMLIKAAWILLVLLIIYVLLRYILLFLLPFLVGFLIAWLLRPVAAFLKKQSGIGVRGASIVSAVIFYMALSGILWLAGIGIVQAVRKGQDLLPQLMETHIFPMISELGNRMGVWERRLGQQAGSLQIAEAVENMAGNALSGLSGFCLRWVGTVAQAIPTILLAALFTIMSSVLICADYDRVTCFVMNQIPARLHIPLVETRNFMAGTLWKLIKAYLILMVITFAFLASGLWFLKIKGFIVIAAIIAILDLLPIIGSGLVLVPWGGGLLLMGDIYTGVGILVVWVLLSTLHQVLEPRIVGDQIGLHPLVTLTAMYVGLKLAGFIGLLAAPVACLLVQHMQEMGYIKLFRNE